MTWFLAYVVANLALTLYIVFKDGTTGDENEIAAPIVLLASCMAIPVAVYYLIDGAYSLSKVKKAQKQRATIR